VVSIGGIGIAYVFYLRYPDFVQTISERRFFKAIKTIWFNGWDFDSLYDLIFVRPFVRIATIIKNDPVDSGYSAIVSVNRGLNGILSKTQTGNIRWYAMGFALGAAVFLGIVMIFS
jgi:NADH-quinone oxidoreductase subunit L